MLACASKHIQHSQTPPRHRQVPCARNAPRHLEEAGVTDSHDESKAQHIVAVPAAVWRQAESVQAHRMLSSASQGQLQGRSGRCCAHRPDANEGAQGVTGVPPSAAPETARVNRPPGCTGSQCMQLPAQPNAYKPSRHNAISSHTQHRRSNVRLQQRRSGEPFHPPHVAAAAPAAKGQQREGREGAG